MDSHRNHQHNNSLEQIEQAARNAPLPSGDDINWHTIEQKVFAALDEIVTPAPSWQNSARQIAGRVTDFFSRPWTIAPALLSAGLVLALGWWILVPRHTGVPVVAYCQSVTGMVYQISPHAQSGRLIRLKTNDPLAPGAEIRCESGATLFARINQSTAITIRQNSRVSIQYADSSRQWFVLSRGCISVDHNRAVHENLRVITPNSICKAIGTVFDVEVNDSAPAAVSTTLTVRQGAVEISGRNNQQNRWTVDSAQMAIMLGDSLIAPLPIVSPRYSFVVGVDSAKNGGRLVAPTASVVLNDTVMGRDSAALPGQTDPRSNPDSNLPLSVPVKIAPSPVAVVQSTLLGKVDVHATDIEISILELPSSEPGVWNREDFNAIVAFANEYSDRTIRYSMPVFSCAGRFFSFDTWFQQARRSGVAMQTGSVLVYPEQDALKLIAAGIGTIDAGRREEGIRQIHKAVALYLSSRFKRTIKPENPGWLTKADPQNQLPLWQRNLLQRAEESFRVFYDKAEPTGKELRSLYTYLRTADIMQRSLLFAECPLMAVPLSEENRVVLSLYALQGGMLYCANTSTTGQYHSVRSLIGSLINEQLSDSVGSLLFDQVRKSDRNVSGFIFDRPEPEIFHPWARFPMTINQKAVIGIQIISADGTPVFSDTIRSLPVKNLARRLTDYRWFGTDNGGKPVPSGYYIYSIGPDNGKKSFPLRISRLQKLADDHPVFNRVFKVSEVPGITIENAGVLPYGEQAVFGVTDNGRLRILYCEGFGELNVLRQKSRNGAEQSYSLEWFANVIMYAADKKNE